MQSLNIHRNDTVKVLTGTDRGKTGRVLRVFPGQGHGACGARADRQEDGFEQAGAAHQGRHRGAGIAHQRVERDAGLPQLRAVARGLQSRGRHKVRVCKKCGQTLPTKK
jgi:large subunit ribosomal protein L24